MTIHGSEKEKELLRLRRPRPPRRQPRQEEPREPAIGMVGEPGPGSSRPDRSSGQERPKPEDRNLQPRVPHPRTPYRGSEEGLARLVDELRLPQPSLAPRTWEAPGSFCKVMDFNLV